MKFLIIRFSSIGDIVLTTPVVRCIKQQVENAEIHYVTKAGFRSLLENNPYIDKLHLLKDDEWNPLLNALKEEKFDCIIDLHKNLRSHKIKSALKKVPSYSFNKLNIQKWLLTALKINTLPDKHIVDRYLETAASFGVVNDGKGLDYFIPEKDVVDYTQLPMTHHAGFYGVVIGAALNTKKLPLEKLKELCSKINHPIVLLGGKEDQSNGDTIAAIDTFKIYNACGKFNINQSADLVRKSKLIITHDTGLMHIAAALKKPIISIWGNTVPAFGMTAYFGNFKVDNIIAEVHHLACRPCSKIGFNRCPLLHFNCMKKQDIDAIVKKIQ